jgi:hypothetical protein
MSQEEGDSDETESRANRLIDRRGRSRERTRSDTETETDTENENEDGQTGQTGQTGQDGQGQTGESTQSAQSDESKSDDEGGVWSETGSENVKRENTALYMYLDQRLHDAVVDVFEDVRYHYRKAYDVELQKNRHVYPLILEHGIEPVREMAESPAEVRDALDANPYTPVPAEVTADA